MAGSGKRPLFKQIKSSTTTYSSPEELFYKLSGRTRTHGYLRGPQQDVLREYAEKALDAADVAFELPTGTGKTAVGLLIGEWWRLQDRKVAYLCLTNQLAGQVLAEAKRLGIGCADVRGTRDTRDSAEEGRYRTGAAVGVTTYSNLFNINPVIREADVLIFDDAHGGEQYVASTWTVSANASKDQALYQSLLAALRPGLSESQMLAIFDEQFATVEMADVHGHKECINNVVAVLDAATVESQRFPWKLIRNRVGCCLFLVSSMEIAIRPLVPPTHTHEPFFNAKQRIYMSATLGGESDLQRAYGVEKLQMIRTRSPQWGRRYVFVPGVYTDADEVVRVVAALWDRMKTRRAVLLTPSDRILNRTFAAIEAATTEKPTRMGAADIADTVDGFVTATDAILGLAGRYDGLDLPDEQCRVLLLSESPAAINALERHLKERWKVGPVMRKRERTRLIQGMGRCTRNATDFAIIIWLGQSLVDAATSRTLLRALPPELSAEMSWGVQQSELAASAPDEFVNMMLGLIEDPGYRNAADADIESIQRKKPEPELKDYEEAGVDEVRYSRAMWDENFPYALETARGIADRLTSAELAAYRAWWWYLASVPAAALGNSSTEQDALRRGSRCGVNSGWLAQLLHVRKAAAPDKLTDIEPNAEPLWDLIAKWGWAGPSFEARLGQMLTNLKDPEFVAFHEGLDLLGKCFGASTTRVTKPGAPDVVWSFLPDSHFAFEAKTEKKSQGTLYKRDVQEAKGHPDWVREHLCNSPSTAEIATVVVAPSPSVDQIALPFAGGLFYVAPETVLKEAERVAEHVRKLRVQFSGRDFGEVAVEFSAELKNLGLTLDTIRKVFVSTPLKK